MDCRTLPWFLGAVGLALVGTFCTAVHAQAASPRVGVVRATSDAMQALADRVDAALFRDLASLAGIDDPVVSPVDLAEVELGVGCSDESRACLAAIARAVRVDALIVRRLGEDEAGNGRLELTYFELSSNDAPTTVQATAAAPALDAEVPSLVRRLFGIAEIAEPAAQLPPQPAIEHPPSPAHHAPARRSHAEPASISAPTWIALGAGAAALTAGVVVGWTATRDFDAWKDTRVASRDDADDARAAFSDIRSRAIAADVLYAVGAVGVGVGVTLLVLDLSRDGERHVQQTRLSVTPTLGGAVLQVRGAIGNAF